MCVYVSNTGAQVLVYKPVWVAGLRVSMLLCNSDSVGKNVCFPPPSSLRTYHVPVIHDSPPLHELIPKEEPRINPPADGVERGSEEEGGQGSVSQHPDEVKGLQESAVQSVYYDYYYYYYMHHYYE